MMKFTITASLLALTLAAPALAADAKQISDATKVLDNTDTTTIASIVTEMGAGKVQSKDDATHHVVYFADGEFPFIVSVSGCDNGKCFAFVPMAIADTSPMTLTLDQINKINKETPFISVIQLDGNKIGFAHVVVMDGGVTRQNIAANIGGFAVVVEGVFKKMANPLTSSLTAPSGTPQAANAMMAVHFRPVAPDPQQLQAIADQLTAQHRATLTQSFRR